MIAASDVNWVKVKTQNADGRECGTCVIGQIGDKEIGHYVNGRR